MNMNWLMFIRVKIENKTEIFEYLWHNDYYFVCKDIKKSLDTKRISGFILQGDRLFLSAHRLLRF